MRLVNFWISMRMNGRAALRRPTTISIRCLATSQLLGLAICELRSRVSGRVGR